MSLLNAEDLQYRYPVQDVQDTHQRGAALSDVNLSVNAGDCVFILGPNGAGKSTLLRLLAGLVKPSQGLVSIDGKDAYKHFRKLVGRTGLLFQDPDDQIFMPTVEEDVGFGPANLGMTGAALHATVDAAVDSVGIPHLRKRAPHHLSYGEKKRVALAGLLAMSPDILLLDEPTANLDPDAREQLMTLLRGLKANGKALVIATHDVDAAAALADRLVVLDRTVLGEGTPRDVFENDELLKSARLRAPAVFSMLQRLKEQGLYDGDVSITENDN